MRLLRNKRNGRIVEWSPERGRMDNLEPLPASEYPEHLKSQARKAEPKKASAKKKAAKKDKTSDKLPDVNIDDLSSGDLNGGDNS